MIAAEIRKASDAISRVVADLGRERRTCLACTGPLKQPREGRSKKYCSEICCAAYRKFVKATRP